MASRAADSGLYSDNDFYFLYIKILFDLCFENVAHMIDFRSTTSFSGWLSYIHMKIAR